MASKSIKVAVISVGSGIGQAIVDGLRRSADAAYPGQANSTGDLSWLRDAAGRVTRETGTLPSTSSWTYDNAGNRLTAASGGTTLSLTTDSLNRYLSTGSGNATHDADGNLTYDPQVPRAVSPACKFTWDAAHRMTEARNFSGVSQVKLGYDAYGRLVRREHTSPLATGAGRAKVELYAHVGGLRVSVYSGNTSTKAVTLIRAIAWGPDLSGTVGGAGGIGGLLSVRETSASTSSRKGLTMLLGHDAKGDITSVWSADGAYLGGYVTQAFGQVTVLSGSSAYLSENQWRLASKPLEWLTGYSHWGRRWYSPFLGRWVSRDPIGENGGVNLYGSCGNDMVSGLDPWGEANDITNSHPGYDKTESNIGFTIIAAQIPTVLCLDSQVVGAEKLPTYLKGEGSGSVMKTLNIHAEKNERKAENFNILVLYGHGCDPSCGPPGMIRVPDITNWPQSKDTPPLEINGVKYKYRYRIVPPDDLANNAKTYLDGYVPNRIHAIWIVGCFASGEVARKVANRTNLPVISTDGVAWAVLRKGTPSVFSVDRIPIGMDPKDYIDLRNTETAPFALPVKYKSLWSVTFPEKK